MQKVLLTGPINWNKRSHWVFLLCALIVVSLIYSRFILSVGMFALVGLSLFKIENGSWRFNWRFRSIEISGPVLAMLGLTLIFWIILISGLWSEHLPKFLERLRIKLPFLIMPFAFIFLPRLTKKQIMGLFYLLIISAVTSALWIIYVYAQDPETYNMMIKKGQHMPTPVHHIRYSLLLALGAIGGLIIGYQNKYIRYRWEPIALFICGLFLFLFLHFLAVRSGLAAAYIALLVLSIFVILRQGKWWVSGLIIIALAALPFIAYTVFPSFLQKMNYVRYDMQQLMKGEGFKYSDATRIRSYAVGGRIFLDHPLIGIGAGDLRSEVDKRFQEEYPESSKYILPHNQFLTILAATGLIGFMLFLTAFIQPLLQGRWKRDLLFLSFQLIAFLSFMVENTLENSVGVAFYCMFTLFFLSYFDGKKD